MFTRSLSSRLPLTGFPIVATKSHTDPGTFGGYTFEANKSAVIKETMVKTREM